MGTLSAAPDLSSMVEVYSGPRANCLVVASILKAASIAAVKVGSSEDAGSGAGFVQVRFELAQRARVLMQEVAPAKEAPAAVTAGIAREEFGQDAASATAEVRQMVVARRPEAVAVLSSARSRIWPPIIGLYILMQIVYAVGRRTSGPIASGALFPICVLLALALYVRARTRLERVERLIYREAVRYGAEKRWWPPIMSIASGLVFLAVTIVTIGETTGGWVSPAFFTLSLLLILGGGLVILRKVRRRCRL
jgi:hypothetical protein